MATFKGKTVRISAPAAAIADKFADLSRLQEAVDALPEDERARMGAVKFSADSISVTAPMAGTITFRVAEHTPQRITLQSDGPMPMAMAVLLDAVAADTTDVTTEVNIEIPAMLKPLVSPHLQKAADQFGVLMAKIAEGRGL